MDKKVLLIADDDEMNRMIIRKFLRSNFEIEEAADGKAAMDILYSKHVDALLLDIIMPEMDGLEVLTAMKKETALDHVGVLVATSTKEKTERQALSLGADDIVSKPYDPVVIKKRMENILAMKEIHVQKKMLQKHEMGALLKKRNQELSVQVETTIQKIQKFSDIIKANKDNFKLVDEITDEIKLEAETVLNIIAKAE